MSSPAGSEAEPHPKKLVHFIPHRAHLVKGTFNLFIDICSDTNRPTVLRKPQIRLHNDVKFNTVVSDIKSLTKK